MIKNVIFDLDGTLLDTLTDIRQALNDALEAAAIPLSYSKSEVKRFIGRGADALLHKALGQYDDPGAFEKLKMEYMPRYFSYQERHTKPYNGFPSVLEYLKNRGISLFVCTNKPYDLAIRIVESRFGPPLFEEVRGLRPNEPAKPDPTLPNDIVSRHSLAREETVLIGDSAVDLMTANNAGLPFALCLWGYGSYKPSLLEEAKTVLHKPKEVAQLLIT